MISNNEKAIEVMNDLYRLPCLKYYKTIESGHAKNVSMILKLTQCLFATSSYDKTIKIWESNNENTIDSDNCICTLQGHEHSIYSLIKIKDNIIASGSNDTTIKLWDYVEQLCIRTIKTNDVVYCLLYINSDILFAGSNYIVHLFNVSTGECLNRIHLANQVIFCLGAITDRIVSFSGA